MTSLQRLRVALIGTSPRAVYVYGPVLRGLANDVEIVAVWGRSEGSAAKVGATLGVPWYLDIEKLVRETAPDIGIVTVNYNANGQVGRMAVEAGLHVLLETPIAHRLDEADAIIAAATQRGRKVEVAEQFHRRPLEQIKLKLIESGLFGRVHSSFNDFAGHGYHGVSVMRSYIGFDVQPVRVTGAVKQYELAAHWSRLSETTGARTETQEHGIVEFSGGQLGLFHWTDVAYDSPLRWWRSSRFLGERGMGITISRGLEVQEWLTLLTPDGEAPAHISLERRWERVDGGRLEAIVAHTGDPNMPLIRWDNPFHLPENRYEPQWHDDEIGVAGCIMSLVNAVRRDDAPTYGAVQARLDQELILAIRQSAADRGKPVDLPIDPQLQTN